MIKKRFLSILALLCLTVSGAWAQEVTLLTTILSTGDNASFTSGSKTFNNIATVSISGEVYNDNDEYGWYTFSEGTLTVTAAEGYTITGVKFYKMDDSAFDEDAPFEAILVDGGWDLVTKIEVYGYANTPATVTLTDGEAITGLDTYIGQEIQVNYTRSFTEGKTSTVCLPFAYTKKEGDGSFYAFTNIVNDGSEYVATMTEPAATTLTANTPYLYMPNADGNVDFSGTYTIPASLTAGSTTSNGWTFKGTYETIEWTTAPTGTYGFSAQTANGIYQGEFVKVGDYVKIKPMRCYLENESFAGARGANRAAEQLPETIKVRLISANGEVTGIGTISTKTGEVSFDSEAWYTLDGRRIEGKPSTKGIYVNNGNKVIIK